MEFRTRGRWTVDLDSDTSYDQLQITGSISLDEASLQVTLGFTPAVGQQFTLIDNQSGSPINGTFTGLAEGAIFQVDNVYFRISYLGGDGNDVVLTCVATDFWTGGTGPSHTGWSNGANWVGGTVPSAGDVLVFPGGVTQTTSTNDFPAGTSFGGILIQGSGYTLSGNAVMLQGGLIDSGSNATVSLPITLGAAAGIVNTSTASLSLRST